MISLLAGLFLSAGLAVQPSPAVPPPHRYWTYDSNRVANPYGIVAAGWSSDPARQWAFRLEVRHVSSIAASDDGQNTAAAIVTWRPWGAP